MNMPITTNKDKATILTSKLLINPDCLNNFAAWQAKLNAAIALSPGFISLEILSPSPPEQPEWLLVQRFYTHKDVENWHQSEARHLLFDELNQYLVSSSKENIEETFSSAENMGGITEVFVTQVSKENEKAYREWIAKIHQAEAKFPGFKGVYVQSPHHNSTNWITLLQFDTPENLDHWLTSTERQKVLGEAKSLITTLDSHRVISPYAGWFASIAKTGKLPPVWKQTMIVLLVLFPIVMLEFKYLSPVMANLNISLATFIGNAISVTLIAWPLMPIAIWFLGWWLAPRPEKQLQATIAGTIILIFLYLVEIAIFWNL